MSYNNYAIITMYKLSHSQHKLSFTLLTFLLNTLLLHTFSLIYNIYFSNTILTSMCYIIFITTIPISNNQGKHVFPRCVTTKKATESGQIALKTKSIGLSIRCGVGGGPKIGVRISKKCGKSIKSRQKSCRYRNCAQKLIIISEK